ncbi:pyruvate, phosphate dikinase [Williamsia sterculiae]|uniref:Pyruvate, orthophosphate dikinase n=1 Tax=Williamsia sterculiae TaxID=1344003 RepID=A0A1N7DKN0_9NOCA|nr:pyruvate, phosphate dikinase [Williamsia sterculiae]SIR76374.1 pyruvate, orthophosphate dikinase [Williamsia sterculiae]
MGVAPATRADTTRAFTDPGDVDVDDVGGKGFGLIEMTRGGLRVPPGFVISTTECHRFLDTGELAPELLSRLRSRLTDLEATTGKSFGGGPLPLLLSVRSGAPISMPGMMDTVLDLGISRTSAVALAEVTGDNRFMADVVFRFHGMYAETVLDAFDIPDHERLTDVLAELADDTSAEDVFDAVWSYCADQLATDGDARVPTDPMDQLVGAIEAVFRSWNTRRAVTYRELHEIPHDIGTAVVIQSMAFGNLDANSGAGVVFTRNPATGEPGMFGEYLEASQGEDVVAGVRTPDPVHTMSDKVPQAYAELVETCAEMEHKRKDMLDIEFTVERGTLYLLQVRSAKRTARAAIRIAADMYDENILDARAAVTSVSPEQIRNVQRPGFEPGELATARADGRVVACGVGASPGQVVGELYLDSEAAQSAAQDGRRVILARPVTSPTDLHGMIAADGIVTATGGSTSHAAVVARALGTTCIVGCAALQIDPSMGTMTVGDRTWKSGDTVSLDGSTGEVIDGAIGLVDGAAGDGGDLARLLDIAARTAADERILGRAHTVDQVAEVLERGADGVVSAVDDVLITVGQMESVITDLEQGQELATAAATLETAIAETFAPLFTAAGDTEFDVRGLDFHADDVAEVFAVTNLLAIHPQVAMPLGSTELVTAQLRGLARAAEGTAVRVCFVSPRTSGPLEARALRELRDRLGVAISVGCYVTNTQGVLSLSDIAAEVDHVWLELQRLQAATYGIQPRHLLSAEPLDGYVRDNLIDIDPRKQISPFVEHLIDDALTQLENPAHLRIRLAGRVSEATIGALRDKGVRTYAVASDEIRPARVLSVRRP